MPVVGSPHFSHTLLAVCAPFLCRSPSRSTSSTLLVPVQHLSSDPRPFSLTLPRPIYSPILGHSVSSRNSASWAICTLSLQVVDPPHVTYRRPLKSPCSACRRIPSPLYPFFAPLSHTGRMHLCFFSFSATYPLFPRLTLLLSAPPRVRLSISHPPYISSPPCSSHSYVTFSLSSFSSYQIL